MEDSQTLLKNYLDHWPGSHNDYDQKRFVRYAIAAHRNGEAFPMDEFVKAKVSERAMEWCLAAFRAVGYTLEVLGEQS
ncbi:MAG: hypothetical protein HFJ87_10555 [Muribaculaceae bacterium]|nr:hypothetical protein [Muribaculaceae bacterium]